MSLTELMQDKLRKALKAERVAVVGASREQLSVGMGPLHNLSIASFAGEVLPVNPKYDRVLGWPCYADLESIHPPPHLAILLLNRDRVLEAAEKAAQHGVQAVTVVAGGFKETRSGGRELEEALRKLAFHYQMPVIGPNTLGFSSFHSGLHGIFWHLDAFAGPVAVVSQSGGVGLTMASGLRSLQCGLSHFIGVGNGSVVGTADYLEILAEDGDVRAFCCFMEGLSDPRSFYEQVKAVAVKRPVVVYKAGRHEEVSRATATHTGNLTGEYRLYQALFRQAGLIEVQSAWEASVAAKALSMLPPPQGGRLCALTFTAGPAIVAMDKLLDAGWEFPDLTKEMKARVRSAIGETTPVDLQNPVDLTGPGFLPQNYSRVLEALLDAPYDAYFLVWSHNPLVRPPLAELAHFAEKADKPVVVVFLAHQQEAVPFLEQMSAKGICAYLTPEDGALALNALLRRRRFLEREESG